MADNKPMLLYAATYDSLSAALADMDALEQLHKDSVIGSFDAAVIDKEDSKPHVAKRLDRPQVRIVPEWFGGEALPRKELHQAAEELTASQAGLIAGGRADDREGARQGVDRCRHSGEAHGGRHDG